MAEAQTENELSAWLSTYGLVTAERILERYKIRLHHEELIGAIKNPHSFYHRLLRIPLKNVFNGIILQQANDYQVYVQKLFIDYLMSGETSKPEESPGGATREDLEDERKTLVMMGEDFHECEIDQKKLIAESQKLLIGYAAEWEKKLSIATREIKMALGKNGIDKDNDTITQALNALIIFIPQNSGISFKSDLWARLDNILRESMSNEVKQFFLQHKIQLDEFVAEMDPSLTDFVAKTNELSIRARQWRTNFYKLILRVNELMQTLPEYHNDLAQIQENQQALYFDAALGEEEDKR